MQVPALKKTGVTRYLGTLLKLIFSERLNWFWFVVLLGFHACYQAIVYYIGLVPSKYYKYLGMRDYPGFKSHVAYNLGLIVAVSAALACIRFIGGYFVLRVRATLTFYFQNMLIREKTLYPCIKSRLIDNPDQRITQDIDKFSLVLRTFLETILINPGLIGYYSYKTYEAAGNSFLGPGVIYAFFVASVIICRGFFGFLVPITVRKERFEGDFRFYHVQVRDNCEEIRFGKSEEFERAKLYSIFMFLYNTTFKLLTVEFPLKFVTMFFSYFGSTLTYLIIAIPIFNGTYDSKSALEVTMLISETAFQTMYLVYQFTQITELAEQYTEFCGYVVRLGELNNHLLSLLAQQPHNKTTLDFDKKDSSDTSPSAVSGVTLYTNNTRDVVIENLSFTLPETDKQILTNFNLLLSHDAKPSAVHIQGPSGIGKSSLYRVLAGLWSGYTGAIKIPENTVFVPQKTYIPPFCTLSEQITYPHKNDCDVVEVLKLVQLAYLSPDHDCQKLSPGEKQKIAIARILTLPSDLQPRFVFLDEPFSSMDKACADSLLSTMLNRGMTCVIIRHDESVSGAVIRIEGNGRWQVRE